MRSQAEAMLDIDEMDAAISRAIGERVDHAGVLLLEPDLLRIVDATAALHRTPAPDPAFVNRLQRDLAHTVENSPRISTSWTSRLRVPSAASRSTGNAAPARVGLGRWASVYAPLVVLLCLTLGGVWLTVGRSTGFSNTFQETSVAIAGPFPTSTGFAAATLRRVTLDPGDSFWDVRTGPTLLLIEQGPVTVETRVHGEERVFESGQTALATTNSRVALRNDSSGPATVLLAGLYLYQNASLGQPSLHGPHVMNPLFSVLTSGVPENGTLRLTRQTIPVGERAPGWQTTGPTWIITEQGKLALTLSGSGVPLPFVGGIEHARSGDILAPLGAGIGVEARNAGDHPLVLTILSIDPDSDATPTG